MKEEKVLINGIETNYKIAGSGPAILVLHGWGGSSNSWVKVLDILSQKGYQVIVPDLPGFGKTIEPYSAWGVSEYADFALQFAEKLKLDGFFLVGHSFGGRTAIKFSSLNPDKLKGLVLVDSAGLHRVQNLSLRQKIVIKGSKLFHFLGSLPVLYGFLRKIAYVFSGARDYYFIKSQIMKETFKKIIKEDLADCLPLIKIRTLIVWGEKDKITPLNIAYLLKEKITDSELEIMPRLGHNLHLESPENLSEIILKFLKK